MTGVIKKYIDDKGYGWIGQEDGKKDVFFHFSKFAVKTDVVVGMQVEFDIESTQKGDSAVNIRVIK